MSVSVAVPLQQRDVSPLCLVSVNVRMSSQAWSCDSSAPPTSTSFHPTSSPLPRHPFASARGFYLLPCPGVTSGIWKFHLIPGQNLSVTGGHAAGGHLAGGARVAAGVREDICAQASPSWPTAMVSHDGGYVLLYVALGIMYKLMLQHLLKPLHDRPLFIPKGHVHEGTLALWPRRRSVSQ